MKKAFLFLLSVVTASTFSAQAQTTKVLTPVSTFGPHGDGTLRSGDAAYMTGNSYQRGLAYNPATGNLILVDRQADGGGTPDITGSIHVLDPLTGNSILTLNTNGMGGGTYADCAVSVSDDGMIYVANMVNNVVSGGVFKIYRWASESDGNPPIVVYSGDPAPGVLPRWGESMDVRGSAADTQIIIGSKTQTGQPGTNVVVFTASDAAATNFVACRLNTDITATEAGGTGEPGMGVAFGAGNTFWTKHRSGSPLRLLSFDLVTSNATTIRLIATNQLPATTNLGPIAVDVSNNLMALADLNQPNSVRLYSISNTNTPPVLLDIESFPTSVNNATASGIFLDFGGGKLYAHSINNGILAMSLDTVSMDPPVFITQPSGTQRVAEGRSIYFETFATQASSYQWQKNGSNLAGATNPTLTLSNVTTLDSGNYSVNAINDAGTTPGSSAATLNVVATSNLFRLTPMWVSAATTGNTLSPSTGNYVNQGGGANTPNQRTLAYNAISNQLLVVSRTNNSAQNYAIMVINATNGAYQYNLKTNGLITSGNVIGLVGIAVADDGAVYACNVDTNNSANGSVATWRLWRWADTGPNTTPTLVFSGEPTGQNFGMRWGDVLCARGSGLNTEILTDNVRINVTNANPYMALLTPADASMTSFVPKYGVLDSSAPFIGIGRSLQYGANGENSIWHKNKGTALAYSTYDPSSSPFAPSQTIYSGFPSTLGAVAIDFSRSLLGGIDFNGNASTPDSVALYDLSDASAPLFIARYSFPLAAQVANANFIGQVLVAGDYLFAIDGNNGLMAFKISSGPAAPPTILSQPGDLRLVSGQSGVMSVSSADATGYQWRKNGSNLPTATNSTFTITNSLVSDGGLYTVVLTNSGGASTSRVATVSVVSSNDVYRLSPKWELSPGTNAPGSFANYVTYNGGSGTPNERTMAYNAQLNELYIVQRNVNDYAIQVIDGTSGLSLRTLRTNGLILTGTGFSGGNFVGLAAIGVAEDGAIYASTLAPDACGCSAVTGTFRLYRWADSSGTNDPVQIFQGDPATQATSLRWGDVMDVTGQGINTRIVMNNNQGTFGAVLYPLDSSMTTFGTGYFNQSSPASPIGRSLQFVAGSTNQIWQKRSTSDLQLLSFDLASNSSTIVTNYNIFPTSLGPVFVDTSRNVVLGINFSSSATIPDALDMYDVSDITPPLLRLSRVNFPINHQGNQNFIGQVIVSGNKVFALSGNNGLVAYDLVSPAMPQLAVTNNGGTLKISWNESLTGFALEGAAALASGTWTNVVSPVSTNNGQKTVTLPFTGAQQYFRLKK